MSLFEELKRRNVIRVGIAYAVGGWLLLQLTDVLSELLTLPDQVGPTVVALVALGFPIVLFLAWAFELTPQGVMRESDVDRSASVTQNTGKKLNGMITVMLAVAVAYLLLDKFYLQPGAPGTAAEIARDAADAQINEPVVVTAAPKELPTISRQSIAVLPFDNRSRLEDDEFFVVGIHDDLLTNLARIDALKVISRTSVGKYVNTEKTIPEIARELGVATIMEGAVQRSGDTVRINVQLIDAATDEHLWAEIFDRKLTADNLFDIQSEISERIAAALETELSPAETARATERPTDNLEAYTFYLRGRQLMASRRNDDLQAAMEHFQRATSLDPDFALAWVGIAETAELLRGWGNMEFKESIAIREPAVDMALALDPQLGEAHLAQAALQYHLGQDAGEHYQRALELSPGSATVLQRYGNYLAREPAGIPEGIKLLQQALELDPLSSITRHDLIFQLSKMGRLEEAQQLLDELLAQEPDFVPAYTAQADLLRRQGKLDQQIVWLRRASAMEPDSLAIYMEMLWSFLDLEDERALARLREQFLTSVDESHEIVVYADLVRAMSRNNFSGALEQLTYLRQRMGNLPVWDQIEGYLQTMAGEPEKARQAYAAFDPDYFDPDRWRNIIVPRSQDACRAAWLMTQTGDASLGEQLAKETLAYINEEAPDFSAHPDTFGAEWCYVLLGDINAALDVVETRFEHRHLDGWFFYAKFPMMTPLVREPRFRAIDEQREAIMAKQRENLARIDLEETGP